MVWNTVAKFNRTWKYQPPASEYISLWHFDPYMAVIIISYLRMRRPSGKRRGLPAKTNTRNEKRNWHRRATQMCHQGYDFHTRAGFLDVADWFLVWSWCLLYGTVSIIIDFSVLAVSMRVVYTIVCMYSWRRGMVRSACILYVHVQPWIYLPPCGEYHVTATEHIHAYWLSMMH